MLLGHSESYLFMYLGGKLIYLGGALIGKTISIYIYII